MARVTYDNGRAAELAPKVGDMYFWYSGYRSVLRLTIIGVGSAGDVHIAWYFYAGACGFDRQLDGIVSWSAAEWQYASLLPYRPPIADGDCGPDERRCDCCAGCRFEITRDSDVCVCFRCAGDGKVRRLQQERPPAVTRRSPYHPAVLSISTGVQ